MAAWTGRSGRPGYLAISNWGVAQVEAHTVSWDEAVVIGRPVHVWVDDGYSDSGANDGHFWGLDAFNTIEAGPVTITGLTIQNAGDSGGDVAAICGRGFAAPVTVQDCHFIGHGVSAAG